MYYLKMAVGVVMCAVGGWQLAGVLGEGEGGGSGSAHSSGSYEWNSRCSDVARRAFGSDAVTPAKYESGMLRLREQGCNPAYAPSGVLPMVNDAGPDPDGGRAPADWGSEMNNASRGMDDWGE